MRTATEEVSACGMDIFIPVLCMLLIVSYGSVETRGMTGPLCSYTFPPIAAVCAWLFCQPVSNHTSGSTLIPL